jgi:hypothetical protein
MGTNQKLQIVKRYRASAIALSAYKIYKKSRDGTWSGLDRLPAVRADLAALASSPGGAMTKSSMVLIAALIVGASAQLVPHQNKKRGSWSNPMERSGLLLCLQRSRTRKEVLLYLSTCVARMSERKMGW